MTNKQDCLFIFSFLVTLYIVSHYISLNALFINLGLDCILLYENHFDAMSRDIIISVIAAHSVTRRRERGECVGTQRRNLHSSKHQRRALNAFTARAFDVARAQNRDESRDAIKMFWQQ